MLDSTPAFHSRYLATYDRETRYTVTSVPAHDANPRSRCTVRVDVMMNDGSWHTTNHDARFRIEDIREAVETGRWESVAWNPFTPETDLTAADYFRDVR